MAGQTQNYYLQNLYKITDKFNVNAKWIAAYTAAFDILNKENEMKINFLSAAGSLDDPSNPVEAIKGVLNLVKWWPSPRSCGIYSNWRKRPPNTRQPS